jgi:hypothetical protein
MSWVQSAKELRWPLPSIGIIVFAAVLMGGSRPSPAKLPCGEQPEVSPVDVADQIKGDADGNVTIIRQASPSVDLRKLVDTRRRELRRKYPGVDKLTIDHYLLWATCQTISDAPELGAAQQLEEYSKLYRFITVPIE